jgi:hypothetical protein
MPQQSSESGKAGPAEQDEPREGKRKAVEDLISGGHLSRAEDKVPPPAQSPAHPDEPRDE